MVTEKQLQANRKNAKLGGIKTMEGKMKSKMNAVKHGILSNEILLDGDFQESPEELENIKQSFYEKYKPEGVIEEFFIQRIVYGIWRIKRAIKAEKGTIQSFTNSFISNKEQKRVSEAKIIDCKIPTTSEAIQANNADLLEISIARFEGARSQFERLGNLTELIQKHLCNYFFRDKNYWADEQFNEANARLNPNVEDSIFSDSSEEEKAEAKEFMKATLDSEIEKLKKAYAEVKKQILNQDTANLYSLLIPNEYDFERLQRYETAIENQIYKAIAELEKYQMVRKNK